MMLNEGADITIWNQLRSGDQQSLLRLYKEYYVGLINFGVKMTDNVELTNDCISQMMLKLWDKRNTLSEVKNVRSYLITCLKNELLIELRKQNKIRSGDINFDYVNQHELSYEEHLIQLQASLDVKNSLSRAFSRLTKREKQLLELKFFEDLSYDEIAVKCDITKRTAYNIIHEALRTLKADFEQSNNARSNT
jgi:RNA polymerase sigma-70 factor (ECF subfamily)